MFRLLLTEIGTRRFDDVFNIGGYYADHYRIRTPNPPPVTFPRRQHIHLSAQISCFQGKPATKA